MLQPLPEQAAAATVRFEMSMEPAGLEQRREKIPFIGLLDDALVVPWAVKKVKDELDAKRRMISLNHAHDAETLHRQDAAGMKSLLHQAFIGEPLTGRARLV